MPNFALQAGRTAMTTRFSSTLVTSTGIYAAGDVIGGAITLKMGSRIMGGGGMLRSVVLTDLDNLKSAVDILLFSTPPPSTDIVDNAKFDLTDTYLPYYLGHVSVLGSDYISFNDSAVGVVTCELPYVSEYESGDVYALVLCQGTPTYTTHASLAVSLLVQQD